MERKKRQQKIREIRRAQAAADAASIRANWAQRQLAADVAVKRNQALMRLGIYVEKAGLLGSEYDVLLGAMKLAAPFERRPDRMAAWRRRGSALRFREQIFSVGSSAGSEPETESPDELPAARRRRNHERFKKGAALYNAGMADWDGDVIRGMLDEIAELIRTPGRAEKWRRYAAPDKVSSPQTVIIRFPGKIPSHLSVALETLGFSFDRVAKEWRFRVDTEAREDLERRASRHARIVSQASNFQSLFRETTRRSPPIGTISEVDERDGGPG